MLPMNSVLVCGLINILRFYCLFFLNGCTVTNTCTMCCFLILDFCLAYITLHYQAGFNIIFCLSDQIFLKEIEIEKEREREHSMKRYQLFWCLPFEKVNSCSHLFISSNCGVKHETGIDLN